MAKKTDEIMEVNEQAAQPEQYDPWKDMRTIKLPRAPKGEENYKYVSVNGVAKQVPCGKTVALPFPLYDVLMKSMEAQDAFDDFRDEIPNEK